MILSDGLKAETKPSLQDAAWCYSEPHARFVVQAMKLAAEHEDGHLPPAGNLAAMSMYIGLFIAGWAVTAGGGYHAPIGPFKITNLGRELLTRLEA